MNAMKKFVGAVIVTAVSAAVAIPSVMIGAPTATPTPVPVKAASAPAPVATPAATPVAAPKVVQAPAAPAASPASSLVDLKQVETAIIAVQGQIVAGNLDAGLKALQGARGQAVTADLASRVGFVAKLAEARMAEKLGDQAKALAALTEVFAMAKQPDQVQATFTVGLAMAQSAVASKGNAVPVVDFLAKGPGPAVKLFTANVEIAKLRIATGNMGAAEAELRNAAQRVNSPLESATWVGVMNQLANAVDGGQAALAGADVYGRMRDAAKAAVSAVDIAKGRFLMTHNILDGVEALADQALSGATSDEQVLSALSLQYDLALALNKAGKGEQAQKILLKAEALAQARPVSAALATVRGTALSGFGQNVKAGDVFWAASQTLKSPVEQEQMLTAFGAAMVAAGDSNGMVTKLQTAKAGPVVYVAVASAMTKAGDASGALKLLGTVGAQTFVDNPQAVTGIVPLMQQIQAQRMATAKDQGVKVKAIAMALDAAAKAAKDPKAAAALTKQAAAMTALAAQVEK